MRSIANAGAGIGRLLTERNMIIHILIGICVIVSGLTLGISSNEWVVIILTIAAVMSAEAINTAIEILSDKVCGQYDEQIKLVKDVSAAGVLIMAVAAVVIGIIIFLPKFMSLL